jgi:hypothetical protein
MDLGKKDPDLSSRTLLSSSWWAAEKPSRPSDDGDSPADRYPMYTMYTCTQNSTYGLMGLWLLMHGYCVHVRKMSVRFDLTCLPSQARASTCAECAACTGPQNLGGPKIFIGPYTCIGKKKNREESRKRTWALQR